MSAQAMVFFLTGLFLEVAWLWLDARAHPVNPSNPAPAAKSPIPPAAKLLWGLIQQPRWLASGVLLGLAGAAVASMDALGVNQRVYIDTVWVAVPTIGLGVYLFFAGMVTGELLPRVNEQSVLIVQLLVMVHQAFTGTLFTPLTILLVVLPAAMVLYLTIRQTPTPPTLKALIYFWYLLSLMRLGLQADNLALFTAWEFTLFQGLVFGILLVFLIVHGLFAIRFFLIVSSLILPRNRVHLSQVMPLIYNDEQVPPVRYLILTGLLLAALSVMQLFNLPDSLLWLDMAIILCVQVFFQAAPLRKH